MEVREGGRREVHVGEHNGRSREMSVEILRVFGSVKGLKGGKKKGLSDPF